MKMASTLSSSTIFAAIFLSGCSNYYVVESTYQYNTDREERPASVTPGRDFEEYRKKIDTLAVQAPDTCISETHGRATGIRSGPGNSRYWGDIMKTSCGVEMANLERALAKEGYNVISWKVLQSRLEKPDYEGRVYTSLEAAKQLGADALFQVNSLERGSAKAGVDARWDRRYYDSNSKGVRKEKALVERKISTQLDSLSQFAEEKRTPEDVMVYSATINASVTYVANGQAIWFYDWMHKNKVGADSRYAAKTVAVCEKERCRRHHVKKKSDKDRELVEGSSRGISIGEDAENRARRVQNKLMKEVIDNMVYAFADR